MIRMFSDQAAGALKQYKNICGIPGHRASAMGGWVVGLDVYFWKFFGKSDPSFDFQCLEISLEI